MAWLITIFICSLSLRAWAADLPVPQSSEPAYAGYYHAFAPTKDVNITYRPEIKDGDPLPPQTAVVDVFSSNDCRVTTQLRYGEPFQLKSGERIHVEKYNFFDTREVQIIFRPVRGKVLSLYCHFPLPANRNLPVEKLTDAELVHKAAQNLQHSLTSYSKKPQLPVRQDPLPLRPGVHQ